MRICLRSSADGPLAPTGPDPKPARNFNPLPPSTLSQMMFRLPNRPVTCLTFVLLLIPGCHAKPSGDKRQQLPLTTVAQDIQRRGYHAKESFVVAPNSWELSTFRMRSKRLFSFRADQPLPSARDTYCRFSFFEETYDSPSDAQYRLANIHLPAPEGREGERDYLSVMRTGFRVGNVTYVLQTDASIFWDEVQRLAKALANSTPGAELTRVITNASQNNSLDQSRGIN